MEKETKVPTRKKPKFYRKDWHKKIKLGSTVKKKRKWKKADGRQNKIRLGRKGHSTRPKIGWSNPRKEEAIRIQNLSQLNDLKSGQEIIIASIGKKKRLEILSKANEMKLKILNKYKEKK